MLKVVGAVILSCVVSVSPAVSEDDCLLMVWQDNAFEQLTYSTLRGELAAYGLCTRFENVPPNRATILMHTGVADGELGRIQAYAATVAGAAFAVPEPMADGVGLLVGMDKAAIEHEPFDSQPLAYFEGMQWQTNILSNKEEHFNVENYQSALAMLETRRVSAILIDNFSFAKLANKNKTYFTRRMTEATSVYIFLAERHRDKSDRFAQAIRAWKAKYLKQIVGQSSN